MKHIKVQHNSIVSGELLEKHGQPCPYCSRVMDVHSLKLKPTKDHVRPKQRLGKQEKDFRCMIVCSECNYMKGELTIEEFIHSLIAKNDMFIATLIVNNNRLVHLEYFIKMGLK